jgi:glycosyltransferase involved in cell wall biosynthesis
VEDFELIIVDDGSTDGGVDVVRDVDDARIRLVQQHHAGVSVARNRGAREAAAAVVAFLDADDAWKAEFLETVTTLRERFPEAAVWGTAYSFHDREGKQWAPRYHGGLPLGQEGGLLDYFAGLSGFCPLSSSAVLVDKYALFEAGGFPAGVVRAEDHDTWLRLALRYSIAWSPSPAVVVYEDAENRTEGFLYFGNYPFLESARGFQRERGLPALDARVSKYLAQRHTGLLRTKWLTGEITLLREISREFRHVDGYYWKCSKWYLLSWAPHPLVVTVWKLRQWLAGRSTVLPQPRWIRDELLGLDREDRVVCPESVIEETACP